MQYKVQDISARTLSDLYQLEVEGFFVAKDQSDIHAYLDRGGRGTGLWWVEQNIFVTDDPQGDLEWFTQNYWHVVKL